MRATDRPTAPDECAAWPKCGLEVSGHCGCFPASGVATALLPKPDPTGVWRNAIAQLTAAIDHAEAAFAAMPPEEQRVRLCDRRAALDQMRRWVAG